MPGPFVREYFDFDIKDVPKGFFLIWRGFIPSDWPIAIKIAGLFSGITLHDQKMEHVKRSIELEGILRRVEARKTNDENGSPEVFPGIFAYTNPDKMKGNM